MKDIEILDKYSHQLNEVRQRIDILYDFYKGRIVLEYEVILAENIAISFRKIVEHIMLLSLVANVKEYSKQHEKFRNHWHAGRIANDIEKINPDFLSKPIAEEPYEDETIKNGLKFRVQSEEFLNKKDLLEIWNESSNVLHARNPFNEQLEIEKFIVNASSWVEKVIALLENHICVPLGKVTMINGILKDASDGKSKAYWFGKV